MKDLTNVELVSRLISLSWVSGSNDTDECDDDIFAIQKELLSRLARVSELEKETARLNAADKELEIRTKSHAVAMNEVELLKSYLDHDINIGVAFQEGQRAIEK